MEKSTKVIVSRPPSNGILQSDYAICEVYPKPQIISSQFDYLDFVSTLQHGFDNFLRMSKRYTIFFGNGNYTYGDVTHSSRPISDNKYISEFMCAITAFFPQYKFNSVLVNFYPHADSHLPFHSDDEPDIIDDSYIVTLSLGTSRFISFRNSNTKVMLANILLEHGDLLIFSKKSQRLYQHSIRSGNFKFNYSVTSNSPYISRISLTFRTLK